MRSWRGNLMPAVGSSLLLGWCALTMLPGCRLFPREKFGEAKTTARRPLLSPLRPTADAIQLDLLVIDRRADDPLIGPLLWKEIDQVGAVPAETRDLLAQNGLLVGRAGARPPGPLLTLLGMVPEIDGRPTPEGGVPTPQISGRSHFIRSGTEAEIQISDVLEECDISWLESNRTRTEHFEQTRCLFRVKPVRLQDGWVRVEFTPEIHHGEMRMRPRPTDLGWTNFGGQNVEKCYSQEFAVTLNVGESAVVTALVDTDGTLGDAIFHREHHGERRQRLLVVRLADMGRAAQ